MKYYQRKALIVKILSYVALGGTIFCLLTGMAFFAVILMMLSFHMSNEAELCKLRVMLLTLAHNQNIIMGVGSVNKDTRPGKR